MLEVGTIVRLTEDIIEDHELIEAGELGKIAGVVGDEYEVDFYLGDNCTGEWLSRAELKASQFEKVE